MYPITNPITEQKVAWLEKITNPIKDTLVALWINFNANGSVKWRTSVYLNLFHWPMGKNF